MVGTINILYNQLVLFCETELNISMAKTDLEEFEIRPAIGFGLPTINEPRVVSTTQSGIVSLDIPVVIEDYGAGDGAVLNVLDIYESFRKGLEDNFISQYATGLDISSFIIGQFQRNTTVADASVRGMIGIISITIKL